MQRKKCHIVWFKRDLRLSDHAPLAKAIESNLPVLLCYFFEPSLMQAPQTDKRHWQFVYQSLLDLQKQLTKYEAQLHLLHTEVTDGLNILKEDFDIKSIYAHVEIGIATTFERDKKVKIWCNANGVIFQEYGQDGVIRGLKHRKNWEAHVAHFFKSNLVEPNLDKLNTLQIPKTALEKLSKETSYTDITTQPSIFQPGGETTAWKYFSSFVHKRASTYINDLSKPAASRLSSSRISPYLAYGNISARQLFRKSSVHKQQSPHSKMLEHFQTRLWWRSHYIQKLESEWQIEFEPINKGFIQLDRVLDERFEAWANAQTGVPMVDASMRCLKATGFINFRMRAMLITYATFTLWQDWRAVATHLARLFLDFEPGIHYAQIQMQAGLTGYHTMRIFNPIVQVRQHDPDGVFIKKWLPELNNIPSTLLATPWEMTLLEQKMYNCILGQDYPLPIVDYDLATREHKDKYWQIRQQPLVQNQLEAIWKRHCVPKNIKDYKSKRTPRQAS